MRAKSSFPSTSTFLTGALIAGGLALLASPRTGPQLRNQIRDLAGGLAGGDVAKSMARRLSVAMERGIEYAETGQQILREASEAMDHAIERGKEYLETGKSRVSTMGEDRYAGWNGNGFATAGALLAGALIGGGLALLMTPQTGTEFRRQIKSYAGKVKHFTDKATDRAKSEMAMVRER